MIGTFIAAWLDTRSRPLRALAAMAGMIAAVTALVMVNAASQLSQSANDDFIESTYGRTATLSIFVSSPPNPDRDDPQSPTGITALLNSNGIDRVSVQMGLGGALVFGDFYTAANILWVSSTYPETTIIDIAPDLFPADTAMSPAAHIVITPAIAADLGLDPLSAVGKVLLYGPGGAPNSELLKSQPLYPVVVDGVSDSMGVAADGQNALLVSDRYLPEFVGTQTPQWLVHVDPNNVGLVIELMRNSIWNANGEVMVRRVDRSEELQPLLDQQEVTAGIVSIVALTVGGLGILGVGLASVRERSQEFGLRRAIGGSSWTIFFGVIVQTLIEAFIASLLGIGLAAVLIRLFARDLVLESLPLPDSTALPVESVALGMAAALSVGLIPAIRASRASIVTALQG